MKYFLCLAVLLTTFGVHGQGFQRPSFPDSVSIQNQVQQIDERLDLTDDQSRRVFPVLWNLQLKRYELFSSGQDFAQVRQAMQQIRAASDQEIRAILNENQLTLYENYFGQRRTRTAGRNEPSGFPERMLTGKVLDLTDGVPMAAAYVTATHLRDSSRYNTVTNLEGEFQLKLRPGRYQLTITFLGYENHEDEIAIFRSDTDLGEILLKPGTSMLEELEIRGQVPQSEIKGDTTIYNSQAFKTNPDANAEDLLRKLPGLTISNGTVQAQGENVQEVLVDGRRFFGNDPNLALRNLPAEVIDKIEVFDQQSEQAQLTGFDDGQTVKTINIITKPSMRDGVFGQVYGGAGTGKTYKAGGNVNLFDNDTRLTIVGQSNNINQQNFSNEDLLGVIGTNGNRRGSGRGMRGGSSGGGSFRRPGSGGDASNFLVGQQNGVSSTHALGVNYSDRWGDKLEVNGSYFYNQSNNVANQRTSQEFFLAERDNQFYDEAQESTTDNFNHRLNMRLEYRLDSANQFRLIPALSFQENNALSMLQGTSRQGSELLSQTMNEFLSESNGYNFNTRLFYSHRFKKRGRSVTANFNVTANKNLGQNQLLAENLLFAPSGFQTDTLDQLADRDNRGSGYQAGVRYTEPLGERIMLMGSYQYQFNRRENDQQTRLWQEPEQQYSLLDSTLSNTFTSDYITQEAGANIRWRGNNFFIFGGLDYQWAQLKNQQFFPDDNRQNFTFRNVLPRLIMRYDIAENKNLRLIYRPRTNEPSVRQLQNVVDNSNPLQVSMGNPNLNQEFNHNLFIRYGASNAKSGSSFFAMLGGSVIQNNITNATLLAERDTVLFGEYLLTRGSQFSQPVNLNGYWNIRSFVTYGIPVGLISSNLNLNLSANYSEIPGIVNGRKNLSRNSQLGAGVVISSNISEQVDFTVSSQSSYNIVTNTLQQQLDNNFFNQNTSLKLDIILPGHLVFRTNLNHQLFRGLSDGFDQNFLLWNLTAGKKLFRQQRGEISLTIFDLLNQNTSINRVVTDAYLEDVQTNVLEQFLMLTFTYQIRNFKS